MDNDINIFDEEWLDCSFHGRRRKFLPWIRSFGSIFYENVGKIFEFEFVVASRDGSKSDYLLLTYPRAFDIGEDLYIVLKNYALGLNKPLDIFAYINLVTICKKFKLNSIQLSGLIGELALILFFVRRGETFIIDAWHKDSKDPFDFYNHKVVLEVKSTRSLLRKHLVKYEQHLKMTKASLDRSVYYVSVMIGTNFNSHSIKDLVRSIEEGLSSEPLLMFQEKMFFYEEFLSSEITFDIEEVLNTIKFYDVTELPILEFNTTLIEKETLRYEVHFNLLEDTIVTKE